MKLLTAIGLSLLSLPLYAQEPDAGIDCRYPQRHYSGSEYLELDKKASATRSAANLAELAGAQYKANFVLGADESFADAMALWRAAPTQQSVSEMQRQGERFLKLALCHKAIELFTAAGTMADKLSPGAGVDSWTYAAAANYAVRQDDAFAGTAVHVESALHRGATVGKRGLAVLNAFGAYLVRTGKHAEGERLARQVEQAAGDRDLKDQATLVLAAAQFAQLRYQEGQAALARTANPPGSASPPVAEGEVDTRKIAERFRKGDQKGALAQVDAELRSREDDYRTIHAKVVAALPGLKNAKSAEEAKGFMPPVAEVRMMREMSRLRLIKAEILHHQRKFAEAESLYLQIRSEMEAAEARPSPIYADVLSALGQLYRQTGRIELARTTQQEAISRYAGFLAEDHPDLVHARGELSRMK